MCNYFFYSCFKNLTVCCFCWLSHGHSFPHVLCHFTFLELGVWGFLEGNSDCGFLERGLGVQTETILN